MDGQCKKEFGSGPQLQRNFYCLKLGKTKRVAVLYTNPQKAKDVSDADRHN